MRPSSTPAAPGEGWRAATKPRALPRTSRRVADRSRRWPALTWRLSLSFFLVPLALLAATLAYRAIASDSLLLTVTDRYTNAPVADAQVTVGDLTVTTDDRGQIEVDPGETVAPLTVRHQSYEPVTAELDPDGDRLALALRPAVLEGRLTDADSGAPIPEAAVSAVADDAPASPSARTDADGRYRLTGVPPDAQLRIEAGDYGVVEEPIGQRTQLDRALKLSVITGAVTDPDGAPLAGAFVAAPDGSRSTVTNPDGTYRLTGGEGLAELLVRAPGHLDQRLPVPANRQLSVSLQREQIKAVYANFGTLGDPDRFQRLIEIADTTEINAIVIDVKQDTIYYETDVPFFRDIPGMITPAYDPRELLALLDEHGLYSIARMVVFKDPVVAEARPDLAVMDDVSGGLWRDMNGAAWVNAFNEELWQANADLGRELATLGFDEVQYDYIRFPSDGDLRTAEFGNDYTEDLRRAAIAGAVAAGAEAVRGAGARFAIDLFPIIAIYGNDQGIGQTLQDLTPLADYVNLMIYPSHYEEGNIPVAGHPNDFPAETVAFTLEKAEELVPGTRLKMRPWLQDFTYPFEGYSAYGPAEVRAQIDATEAFGASGWMLWNAAGEFEVAALAAEA